eukprot:3338251-Amphidinium_carterae.2
MSCHRARRKESERPSEAELFSATPPLENLPRLLAWIAAKRTFEQRTAVDYQILTAWDVRRARFHGVLKMENV